MSTPKRRVAALVVVALIGALVPMVVATPAMAADPDHVSITLEGCKPGNYDPVTVTCDDGDYTPGNLGKSWNELDLVPFRLTLDPQQSAPSSQTYTITYVLDAENGGEVGYDVISEPTLVSGDCIIASSGQMTTTGFGGTDESIYRELTVTQGDETCVVDFYGRLAVGSHLFDGSSLHANVADEDLETAGIGARDVSIPVKEIAPQELDKEMTAVRDADHSWTIEKTASPVDLDFGNICDLNGETSAPVTVTISWTKGPAVPADEVLVTTVVTATNPAHRDIKVLVSDVIYSGTTVLDMATNAPGVVVPADTSAPVLTHQVLIDAADAVDLNDEATATYIDEQTGVPVPGQTTATASALVQDGTVTNATATITDTESITGSGLEFSVAAPSVGSFTNYTEDTKTTGPVEWSSGVQSGSGSVTFNKTVYFDGLSDTTGVLSDTATLTTSGNVTSQANASVDISADSQATLTINKTTSIPVDDPTDFVFNVTGPNGFDQDVTVSFAAGEDTGSATLSGLEDGDYNVEETDSGLFAPQPDQQFVIGEGDCEESLLFENTFDHATAEVTKVTVGEGSSPAGFEFTLFLDDDGLTDNDPTEVYSGPVTTDATGTIAFPDALADEGHYYVLETDAPDGYVPVGPTVCEFDVNYPEDADQTFTCEFTNALQATAEVIKETDPEGFEAGWMFTLYLDDDGIPGAGDPNDDTVVDVATTDASGEATFDGFLAPGNYYVLETGQDGWESDGGDVGCAFTVEYPANAGGAFTCTFTNTARGSISVQKTVNDGNTSTDTFDFELRTGVDINEPLEPNDDEAGTVVPGSQVQVTADGQPVLVADDLVPGTYSLCEFVMPGWTPDLGAGMYTLVIAQDNVRVCVDVTITVQNQDVTVIADNDEPPGGEQRTIGFWKNWSSCTGGNQDPVLDQTLASFPIASGETTHGVFVGNLYVDTCTEAVKILDKSTLSGQKKASDPGFNLASQYLAAVLNQQAGAEDSCITQTLIDAQAALVSISFDGTKVLTKAQIKSLGGTLNALAETLDDYNNGLLC